MRQKNGIVLVIIIALLITMFSGCQSSLTIGTSEEDIKKYENSESQIQDIPEEKNEENKKEDNDVEENENEIDFEKIKPNENGKIMILMYHGIGQEEQEWVRTPENFRKDLQTLYDKGYRLISLKDYMENNIDVEAGYTPFVLTFDDGLQNQFNIIEENGEKKIDPDCAVGIMEDFIKEHPDFGRGASFYVFYPVPFRQKELIKEKYEFLIKNGYEIGNHGYNHENLGKVSIEEVQKSLAKNAVNTKEYIDGYEVYSLALPYGAAPKDENYRYVVEGEYESSKYYHRAVLKVGSNPALAPNHTKFDSSKLPRVRGSEMNTAGTGLYDWLAHFEKKPHERYISDGNPDTIAIPEAEESNINLEKLVSKRLIKY